MKMVVVGKEKFACEGCGCITDNLDMIFSFDGQDFCVECVDHFQFVYDSIYGIIAEFRK